MKPYNKQVYLTQQQIKRQIFLRRPFFLFRWTAEPSILDSYALRYRRTLNSGLFCINHDFYKQWVLFWTGVTELLGENTHLWWITLCSMHFFYIFNETKDYQPKGGAVHSWRHPLTSYFTDFIAPSPFLPFFPSCILYSYHVRNALLSLPPVAEWRSDC